MWLFPLAAALVSLTFSLLLALEWRRRPRPHLLAWSVALAMFAGASLAAAVGILEGWSPAWYRTYYLLGAIVNVPVLGLGTLYLLSPRPLAHVSAVVVAGATAVAAFAVVQADLNVGGLHSAGLPRGSDVMPEGVRMMSRIYSITGFVVVVAGALWSAWRLARRRNTALRELVIANVLIAVGTVVVAAASEVARVATGSAQGSLFGLGLFVGVTAMFAGFLMTRRRPPDVPT